MIDPEKIKQFIRTVNGQDNFSKQMFLFTCYWRFQLVQIHKWEYLKFQSESEQFDEILYLKVLV